jgi:hypothetical protein
MNKKNGSALVVVLILILLVLVIGALIFFGSASKLKNGAQAPTPAQTTTPVSTQDSYTFKTISFTVLSANEKVQQTENIVRLLYPDGRIIALLSEPDGLAAMGTKAIDVYKSTLGTSNFSSNYALYSYLLQLTTSSVENSASKQEATLKSALLNLKQVLILTDSNHDISNKNQNGIKGVEGTRSGKPQIEIFDNHDMKYTALFNGFSRQEAEAVFTSIKPTN